MTSSPLLIALGAMFLQQTFASVGKVLPAVVAPLVIAEFDADPAWVGVYYGVAAAASRSMLPAIPMPSRLANSWSDRHGRGARHRGRNRLPHVSRHRHYRLSRQWRRTRARAGNGGAREPAHDQALRPHEGAAHAGRGEAHPAVGRAVFLSLQAPCFPVGLASR